ncbi:HEAT repeat domain-containing protein [Agarilytica rhodophyticola]|uniref:HEAT repeat domain-containing protein n=1 Tax=Agarilytica rhodophyticola TaxID=1737490 RepID=UPI000B347B98|nr:HEAT repeat domain-containing protein [Agarilytica rhodophyticola]
MNHNETKMQYDAWIMDYLYGGLDAEQRLIFEQTLESDEQLRKAYESQCEFDEIVPKGLKPVISEQRTQGVRWSAFHNIRRKTQPSDFSLVRYFRYLWSAQVSMRIQFVSMAMMFAIGLFFSSFFNGSYTRPQVDNDGVALNTLGDNNIVDMQLEVYDRNIGNVEFSFTSAAQSKVQGNLSDPRIRNLLAKALHINNSDEVRLELSEMLGAYVQDNDIKSSLIYILTNDPNPGVRYNAVTSLVKDAADKQVRRALQYALVNDVNTGVRVEAFLALTKAVDEDLLKILRQHSIDDANTLIRERSKRLLEKFKKPKNNVSKKITVI